MMADEFESALDETLIETGDVDSFTMGQLAHLQYEWKAEEATPFRTAEQLFPDVEMTPVESTLTSSSMGCVPAKWKSMIDNRRKTTYVIKTLYPPVLCECTQMDNVNVSERFELSMAVLEKFESVPYAKFQLMDLMEVDRMAMQVDPDLSLEDTYRHRIFYESLDGELPHY